MTINYPHRPHKLILTQLLESGLAAADPGLAIQRLCTVKSSVLTIKRRRYHLKNYNRVVCIGVGKASAKMGQALRQRLGNRLDDGLLVVKDLPKFSLKNIEIFQAGHPTPDSRSRQAATLVQQILRSLTPQDLLLTLISGGASSLVASPAPGLTLKDKQLTTNQLLRSGASIQEINTVRKHLSALKGGKLLTTTSATVISLILSDVLGDDLETIGSGLTASDSSTFLQARHILNKYHLWKHASVAVKRHIEKGIHELVPETLKPGDPHLKRVHNVIIGNNQLAVRQISKTAKQLGLRPIIQTRSLENEATEAGNRIAVFAKRIHKTKNTIRRPSCIIWGGEPTVKVTGNGKGGRAQECALSAAIGISGLPNMIVAGFGTDGSDGPTDVAGAVVNGETFVRAKKKNLDACKFLQSHNSYTFFKRAGGHIRTGSTGTNVNDIYLLLAL
ncbi:MAG: hydroxypyruvate reductase [Nitrospirales bacterium]|nr:MAG: hydroxypyruvate reductase [Nitrospirales bacterium]